MRSKRGKARKREELPYNTFAKKYAFIGIVGLAVLLALSIKGIVLGGMFMGIMITIAVWLLVLKLPDFVKNFMSRHILLSDLILSIGSLGILSAIGPGPTVVMAASTEAALLSLLLKTL
jgi:hypothetical protein